MKVLVFMVIWTGVQPAARVFRDPRNIRSQYLVRAATYSPRRILRSSPLQTYDNSIIAHSKVFKNVQQVIVNDEPRLYRASGRFHKRAQAVPTHDIASLPLQRDMVQNISYSYDEENHHVNKLTEDSKTMFEAVEYAKVMERTTVAIKTMQSGIWSTTPLSTKTIPTTQVTPNSKLVNRSSSIEERRYEVHQPPPVFAQPPPLIRQPQRTFSQTVLANGNGQLNQQISSLPSPALVNGLPQQPPIQISPSVIPGPNVVPPVPNLPQIPPPLLPGQIAQIPQGLSGSVPPLPAPGTERFEVINAQAANSSLEQLGCGFDWLTNSCKDVFGVGWCGHCHDFGNIFLHDCKCVQPLIPLPPRPPQPKPAFAVLL